MVTDGALGLVGRCGNPCYKLALHDSRHHADEPKLMATEPKSAGPQTRALIEKWAALHGGRTALGLAATLIFVWASMS